LIRDFYLLNRSPVSEDTDKLVERIRQDIDCRVLEFPSGQECLTWLTPKSWKVREGYLAKMDGTRIVDFNTHPLHLWTHSISFDGEVSRKDLEQHLYFDAQKPEWVPYHFRNGFRYDANEWGFCLSHNDYKKLNDDRYKVFIDADLDNEGSMKVVDWWLKGELPDTILIAAHTCHPGIVTDGISNVAVAIELFKALNARASRRYSYRLVLGPEYFAAAGLLSAISESEIGLLRNGIFLDMLGNNESLGYQTSYQGDSRLDHIVQNVFSNNLEKHVVKPYRKLWGNDEMFYNGPGFNIPTLGIGGDHHPYYHFDRDDMEMLNLDQLEMSLEILLKIIEVLETDFIPVRKFKGPLYLSRYDLYIDPKLDRNGYDNLEQIQILMDGNRTCFDISHELDVDFFFVRRFCEQLYERQLIDKRQVNSYA